MKMKCKMSPTFFWCLPGSLVGCSPWGLEESDMTERLHFHFSLSCIGEANGNPLHCSCLENPRDGGAWWAAVYGVAQSRTRLKWLSSSSRQQRCTILPMGDLLWEDFKQRGLPMQQPSILCLSSSFPETCPSLVTPWMAAIYKHSGKISWTASNVKDQSFSLYFQRKKRCTNKSLIRKSNSLKSFYLFIHVQSKIFIF